MSSRGSEKWLDHVQSTGRYNTGGEAPVTEMDNRKPLYVCPECGFWSGQPHHKGDPCWNRSQHGGKKGPPLELSWHLPASLLSEIADVATGCLTRASGELTEQQMVFFEPLQELLRDHSTPEGEPGLNEEVARWKRKWIPAVDTRDIDPTPEEEK